jgi:2-polyprenyl-3-methyl-5-hydroxy-6-metoxy-1,4-benzoquinol methylase
MSWVRQMPVMAGPATSWRETWRRGDVSFDLDVTFGKTLDVMSLKGSDLGETRRYATFLTETAARLYAPGTPRERLSACPVCAQSTADATEALRVFDIAYLRCAACGHGFVGERPTEAALKSLFTESDQHAGIYVDKAAARQRVEQIVKPKLDWVLGLYQQHLGRRPASVVDVGAGGGHFLAAAQQAGIAAEGFELSRESRRFAQEAFGLELRADDYLATAPQPRDLVTYWGLLEYVSNPPAFMTAARQRLAPGAGMLIVEVPRLDALGTVVQAVNPTGVARHMDPTSHINCFSDLSLITALVNGGFRPVAAWYFGLDAYELLVQSALMSGTDAVLSRGAAMIAPVQAALDRHLLCDDLIVAAVPV